MDIVKKHVTSSQVKALMDFMKRHPNIAKGVNSGLEREDVEAQWQDLTVKLNSMGGPVKSVDKWKKTWSYLKWNTKKRAMKQQQSFCDTSIGTSSDHGEPGQNIHKDTEEPSRKRFVSFDEEIVKIERDKLELEREYKIQKIEVLSRIAAALEELANK
ncbi:unnamed protein product [Arctia plantaginis]|uniref:Regulatory protein zeste n=1 Tax=Arctia plantaginis TaxID=874455 RepID=A0A8S1AU89_ARCPL|nr:unnamed protein product [Arctia plantaginis]